MNRRNIILGAILLLFAHITYAQKVGINTDTPQATLDVNGSLRVRKDIKLGNTAGTAGSSGAEGYGFTSQGAGKSPAWAPMGLDVSLGFGITQSTVLNDSIGVMYTDPNAISTLTAEWLEDSELSTANGWTELSNLKAQVIPTKSTNRLVVTLQTAGQSRTAALNIDAVFAIGVFLDGKLKSVRPLHIFGSSMIFAIGTLFDSFENLPPKANNEPYTVQIATAIRYKEPSLRPGMSGGSISNSDYVVFIGRTMMETYNTNNLMNMTTMKLELFEDMME